MTRILCIEDENDFLEEVVDILNSEGFEAVGVQDGENGLQKISEIKPDLVLCDVAMPGMSGFDVLKAMREQSSPVTQPPFIFVSARYQQKETLANLNLQADDYFVKPVDFGALLSKIRSKLAKHPQYPFATQEASTEETQKDVLEHMRHSLGNISRLIEGLAADIAGQAAQADIQHYLRYTDHLEEHASRLRRQVNTLAEILDKEPASDIVASGEERVRLHQLVERLYGYLRSQRTAYQSPLQNQISKDFSAVMVDEKYFSVALANILEQLLILATDHEPIIAEALPASADATITEGGVLCRFTVPTQHPQLFMVMNTQFATEIMKLHGGSMNIHRYEEGVQVTFQLPAYRVE